jgi:hypothetical protein
MSIHRVRTWFYVTCVCVTCYSLFAAADSFAQKKEDQWVIQNAQIGPDSPIEVRAGGSYVVQAMYPNPDGPLSPLKASVQWSIAPAIKGISIDTKSGKISVDASVPHGATTTVHADVNNGRRKLEAKLYVFRPEENPLIGRWYVDPQVACGDAQESKSPVARPRSFHGTNWKFHVDQKVWVGKEMNIAAGTWLMGDYTYDLKSARIKITTKWPVNKPVSNWSYVVKDGGKTLLLHPLEPWEDLEPGCSYILTLR